MTTSNQSSGDELVEKMRAKRGGWLSPGQAVAARFDSEFLEAYDQLATRTHLLTEELREKAVVDQPTRELLIIAATATRLSRDAVRLHVDKALKLGVSPATIVDAAQILMITSGGPSYFMVMDELGASLESQAGASAQT